MEVDGELWHDGGVFLLAVANGRSFGKGMRIAPRAEVDDGLADLVLVRPLPGWQVPLQLPRLYLGRHLGSPYVDWRRARRVRLEPAGGLPPFDLDGETLPSGAGRVRTPPRRSAFRLVAGEPGAPEPARVKGDPMYFALLESGLLPGVALLVDLGCGRRGILLSLLAAAGSALGGSRASRSRPPGHPAETEMAIAVGLGGHAWAPLARGWLRCRAAHRRRSPSSGCCAGSPFRVMFGAA